MLAELEIIQRHSRCVNPPLASFRNTTAPANNHHHGGAGERVQDIQVPVSNAQSNSALESPLLVSISVEHSHDSTATGSASSAPWAIYPGAPGEPPIVEVPEPSESVVEATDLTLSGDEDDTCPRTLVVDSDVRSHIARYNKPVQLLTGTVINDNTVECLACTRAQRHRNPFRIDRNSRRPGAFLQAIDQHCSSTAADGGPGTHTRNLNVEAFRAYLKSQTQISFMSARSREPEQGTVIVKCRDRDDSRPLSSSPTLMQNT